jgi:DNA-directed RNA polymerase II subunit RPB1
VFKDKIIHKAEGMKKEYTTSDIQQILKKYDEINKPEQPASWLLTTILPVMPPCSRPSIMNKNAWCHNSLSHSYSNIIKENNVLGVFLRQHQPQHIILQQWRRCQDQIYKIYDVRNMQETTYMEGIRQRLDSKQGRMRKHLCGKRVDFSARTVVGGDTRLKLDEIGIPTSMAMRLSIPEIVTHFNRERMMKKVRIGPDGLGGALYVIRKFNGEMFDLSFSGNLSKIASQLRVGDTVDRMLEDGDLVICNRQPSLHKYSVMSMRVKVLSSSSVFKINLSVTSPLNADCKYSYNYSFNCYY